MGRCDIGEKVKSFDQFGQSFQFRLDSSGETEVKSFCGASLTMFIKILLFVYVAYKFNFLLER